MKSLFTNVLGLIIFAMALFFFCGCGPRFNVVTQTGVGIIVKAGDGTTTFPSVSVAYKRSEVATIPTSGDGATMPEDGNIESGSDTYSAFCSFYMESTWFGETKIHQFISTGHASKELQKKDEGKTSSSFIEAFTATE